MEAWQQVYVQNLPVYMQLIERYFEHSDIEIQRSNIEQLLDRLSFKLPKGLTKKEIHEAGRFPVVSQSKEMIIGYSDVENKVISDELPLIIYGDHSKTIKFIDFPFVIGADGVKLLKPKRNVLAKYFYYGLIGLETDTKNYGRHFSLLKKKSLTVPSSLDLQSSVVRFVEDLETKKSLSEQPYFSEATEQAIHCLQNNSIVVSQLANEHAHQQTLLKKLRQQILQEAIEGKLTADWRAENPDVEPASGLLKRIAAEKAELVKAKKIKKQKPLPPISDDEKPFELPEGWEWCQLGEAILIYEAGKSFKCIDRQSDHDEWGVIKTSAITSAYFREEEHKFYQKIPPDDLSKQINPGDLIFCRASGSKGLAGKCCIVGDLSKNLLLSDKTPRVILSKFVNMKYVFYHNESVYTDAYYAALNTGKSTSMNNITKDQLMGKPVPLPPAEEQEAIVAKVEKLLAVCDQLETQITHNQTHADALMQAVLREAFTQGSPNKTQGAVNA